MKCSRQQSRKNIFTKNYLFMWIRKRRTQYKKNLEIAFAMLHMSGSSSVVLQVPRMFVSKWIHDTN